jgi:hypothetical protein
MTMNERMYDPSIPARDSSAYFHLRVQTSCHFSFKAVLYQVLCMTRRNFCSMQLFVDAVIVIIVIIIIIIFIIIIIIIIIINNHRSF